jgi:rRNA maturation endonuclease Nob1
MGVKFLGQLNPRKLDEAKTKRVRCIGCGKFVSRKRRWNQCPDCDTREPEEMR